MYIYLFEQGVDGITLEFPAGAQPGAYPLEGGSYTSSTGNTVGARYDVPGDNAPSFRCTNGTLTLTAVGPTFSGQFQFTTVDSQDASKTIEVSGFFTDVPVTP